MKRKFLALALVVIAFASVTSGCYAGHSYMASAGHGYMGSHHFYRGY